MCVRCGGTHALAHEWRSEEDFLEYRGSTNVQKPRPGMMSGLRNKETWTLFNQLIFVMLSKT